MDTRTLCLAVLQRGDASGYEIKKTLEQPPYSHFQDTSFGSIYPALNQLAEQRLVVATAFAQEKRPDKKVYAITEAGRSALVEALLRPPGPDRFRSDFLFLLFYGDLLPPEVILAAIDARIAGFEGAIEAMRGCTLAEEEAPSRRFVHAYGLDYYRNAVSFLKSNRSWLEAELRRSQSHAAE